MLHIHVVAYISTLLYNLFPRKILRMRMYSPHISFVINIFSSKIYYPEWLSRVSMNVVSYRCTRSSLSFPSFSSSNFSLIIRLIRIAKTPTTGFPFCNSQSCFRSQFDIAYRQQYRIIMLCKQTIISKWNSFIQQYYHRMMVRLTYVPLYRTNYEDRWQNTNLESCNS